MQVEIVLTNEDDDATVPYSVYESKGDIRDGGIFGPPLDINGVDQFASFHEALSKCEVEGWIVVNEDDAPNEFTNYYECPNCENKWDTDYTCGCDDECPVCESGNIEAYRVVDITKPIYHKTIITVEVLSETPYELNDLASVAHDIVNGDCSGSYTVTGIEIMNGKDMALELSNSGSEPEFFQLTPDGEEIDE